MADIRCLSCGHGPHRTRPCQSCPCKEFVDMDAAAALSLVQLNNLLHQKIPLFHSMMLDLLEIVAEQFPEAVARIDAKREERRKQLEDQIRDSEREGVETASQYYGLETDKEGKDAGSGRGDGAEDLGREEGR